MKAVFFDIDGTIWDAHMWIPESTKRAIRALRENGHLTFICSGRTRAFIQAEELLDLGFDGIIAGCGTYIEEHGKELFYKKIEEQEVKRVLAVFRSCHMPVVMEGKKDLYLDAAEFAGDDYPERMRREIGEHLLPITGNEGKWEISKFSCALPDPAYQRAVEELKNDYEILIHDAPVAEFVPKGFSKASGIQKACELFSIAREDTYAFGDSVNDLDMLRYVAHGVAMGNGTKEAKEAADYVTTELKDDGIYQGLLHYGLIREI